MVPEQPTVNIRLQIAAKLTSKAEAIYKIPSGKTAIMTVAGMLVMLKNIEFFKSCFIPHW